MPARGGERVADGEREEVVSVLRVHAGDGRLDVDELAERVDRALAAKTRADLAALTADLPAPSPDRADRMRAWREELRAYVGVMVLLVGIWLATGAEYPWPVFPALGWGIPLALGRPRTPTAPRRTSVGLAG